MVLYEKFGLWETQELGSLLKEVPGNIDFKHTGESRVLKGIAKDMITVPLVEVHLRNDFMDEPVLCGLVPYLPDGIDFWLPMTFG